MDSNTKIVWNRIADVTGVRRPHDFSTLMHIHRPLNSSDIVVSIDVLILVFDAFFS